MKKELITGTIGQDGSYLAELMLEKGYDVHGIIRRCSTFNKSRIEHLYQYPNVEDRCLVLERGDLTDSVARVKLMVGAELKSAEREKAHRDAEEALLSPSCSICFNSPKSRSGKCYDVTIIIIKCTLLDGLR